MNTYRRYNLAFMGITLPGLLAIGLFNMGIDPYGVMNSRNLLGLNRLKPFQFNHVRLFKAVDVTRIEPKTILLGSSRTDLGMDPAHPALKQQPGYNMGLVGPNMYEVKRYFDHALANQPDLKTVVIGLDFFMFNQYKTNEIDFSETRLERDGIAPQDLLKITLSIDAFEDSGRTIKSSLASKANFLYYPNGLRYVHNNEPERPIPKEFQKMIDGFLKQEGYYKRYELSEEFLASLQEIVEIAKERNLELKMFISPSHAAQWEALRLAGHWPVFEQWKRELVKIAPVWDFSGYNSITTEPIAEDMKNYWDSSHYRKEVGDLVLNRMFDEGKETVPNDFGVLMTPENIESHLEKIRGDRESWATKNQDVVKFVKEIKSGG